MQKCLFVVLAVFLAAGLWGCTSVHEKKTAEDPCTASGGIRVDDKCYPRSQDKSGSWSDKTLQEMNREFKERQPGGGRFH
jgi:hypothetical protein